MDTNNFFDKVSTAIDIIAPWRRCDLPLVSRPFNNTAKNLENFCLPVFWTINAC